MRNVLISMDETSEADNAFLYYKDNIHRSDNHVILLYVPQFSDPPTGDETEKIKVVEEKLKKKLQDNGLTGDVKSIGGRPAETIVKVSKEDDAKLIVLGTRSSSIKDTFMGGVSDYVMHNSYTPVLVCKS